MDDTRCTSQIILILLVSLFITSKSLTTGWKWHRTTVFPDLINNLDKLHGGKRLSCSILNGCQDLLLSLVPVAHIVSDLRASILNHRAVT